MRIYIYCENNALEKLHTNKTNVCNVIQRVSRGTDTADLLIIVYFLTSTNNWRGEYCRNWCNSKDVIKEKGVWKFTNNFKPPDKLPEQFKLIRLVFGTRYVRWPRRTECEHMKLRFKNVEAQIAYLFGHELHHFRCRHLGLHPGAGEIAATRWGFDRARKLGYEIQAVDKAKQRCRLRKIIMRKYRVGSEHIIIKAFDQYQDLLGKKL